MDFVFDRKRVLYSVNIVCFFATSFLLFVDSFFYPGASLKYFDIESNMVLFYYSALLISLALFRITPFPNWFLSVINRIIFPLSAVSLIFFILLKNLAFETAVLTYFHIHIEFYPLLVGLPALIYYLFRPTNYQPAKWLIYLFPPLLLFILAATRLVYVGFYELLIAEDSFFEYLQFIAYFIAGVFSLKVAIKKYKSKNLFLAFIYFMLSLSLIFVAFEEISWGQRILNVETPQAIADNNFQGELTIHNLRPIQKILHYAYMIVGIYGAFGRYVLHRIKQIPDHIKLHLAPPGYLTFYFFAVTAFYVLNDFIAFYYEIGVTGKTGMSQWQEVSETFLSLGFMFFVIDVLNRTKHKIKNKH